MSAPSVATPDQNVEKLVVKSPYKFAAWQAFLIAVIIGLIVEVLLIKFTTLRSSTIWCITMLVFIFLLAVISSPFARFFTQLFVTLVFVIIIVAFGTETYRITMAAD